MAPRASEANASGYWFWCWCNCSVHNLESVPGLSARSPGDDTSLARKLMYRIRAESHGGDHLIDDLFLADGISIHKRSCSLQLLR
jgi:hypothetical protein